MTAHENLQQVLFYIDDNLDQPLDTALLAARAGYSVHHFCRMFRALVGLSVMGYVRGRRLAHAAAALATGQRVLDIALAHGFETHSGFAKAFRRHFGCPPETYRAHAQSRRPEPPLLELAQLYATGGIVMEPKFVTLPQLELVGFVLRTTSVEGKNIAEIPLFWEQYMSDGRLQELAAQPFADPKAEYGACMPIDPETEEFDYIIGFERRPGAEVTAEYELRTVPPATYVVFSTPPADGADFPACIQGTWQFIFNEWFPDSGYEYAAGCVDFEYYDERSMGTTGKVCDIYIPVVKTV